MVQKQDIQDALDLIDGSVRGNDMATLRAAHQRVHGMLQMLGTVRIQECFGGHCEILALAGQRELSKEQPQVTITDHHIVLRTQVVDLLKNVFMHLYRNSMDHGIESGSERVAKGKALAGHIQLELSLVAGRFLPGLSTAEQVTEVSGWDVGMDAVQSFVQREEGSIELRLLNNVAALDGYRQFETVISLPSKLAVQGSAS
jgi:two-component system, chemotaxis family, sensor kinase CheA